MTVYLNGRALLFSRELLVRVQLQSLAVLKKFGTTSSGLYRSNSHKLVDVIRVWMIGEWLANRLEIGRR